MIVMFQWMSQLLRGSWGNLDNKHSMVMCSYFNTNYVMLTNICYFSGGGEQPIWGMNGKAMP